MNADETGARRRIAIVGIGCRFGGARDLHEYWELTREGRDAFGPIPEDRWDFDAFYNPNTRATDKSYAPAGAFIDDVRSFPAVALQIPPRRVEVMDPQQRVALETALQAVEDSGRRPDDLPPRTGVYMGVTATEYRTLMDVRVLAQMMATGQFGRVPDDPAVFAEAVERIVPPRPFTAPGSLANMIAAAIAQEFHLTGPAYTVDAACSSGLVAVADAVTALRHGDIEVALAGGAYVCVTPDHHVAFSRIGAMSKQGQCLPFDARADGFVQGDGAGVLMLKRLEDATRDGDRIYAVIEGVGANNDGGWNGPMAPVKAGQCEVIERAWADAGRTPENLGYVEAHGTGTSVGDQVEFEGLNETLGANARDVVLGSSKANVGHTMSAAGIAGIIRAVLALYRDERPPMANFEAPKADLGIEETPFRIPTTVEPWTGDDRVACVSAFGFGGTNIHTVLSNAPPVERPEAQAELVLMSGPDEATLRDLARRTAAAIDVATDVSVAEVARAWNLRRRQPARLGVVATTREELVAKLREIGEGGYPAGFAIGTTDLDQPPQVAFLYPGQGAQRIGMLAGIRDRFPIVAETLAEADTASAGLTPRPVTSYLYPERRDEPVDDTTATAELTATEICQPALLAVGVALTRLLRQVGVTPVVTAGHSVGEFTACVASGVLDLPEGIRWAAERGRGMAAIEGDRGAMAAIVADPETVESLLVPGAVIANVNHPRQLVVSGTSEAVEQVALAAEARELKTVRLNVSHGFHSQVFDALDLDAVVDGLTLDEPQIPVASCVQDRPYADAAEARAVFRRHAQSPVWFTRTLKQCQELGADVFLQVGAGGPLVSFAKGTLGTDQRGILSAASKEDGDGGASFLASLAELWVRGVDLDLSSVTAPSSLASVPPLVLPREEYWGVKRDGAIKLKLVGPTKSAGAAPAAMDVVAVAQEQAPAATTGPIDVSDLVVAAVARASAYPLAALKPEMRLVDDLGFDSMMVSDLAEELTKSIEGVQGIPQELLINSPTIQDLIDFARDPGVSAGADAGDDDAELYRYAPTWRPTAFPAGEGAADLEGRRILVAGPGDAAALRATLGGLGCTLVEQPTDPFDVLVYVSLGVDLPPVTAILAEEAAMPDLADDLVGRLDALAGADRTCDIVLVRDVDEPWSEALSGAVRAVAREWTDRVCKAISVDPTTASRSAELVALELASADRSVDVRHVATGRQVLGAKRIMERAETWQPKASDVVVITGGTRGIGLKIAERVAPSGARIVLAGRSAPGPEARALIDGSKGRVSFTAVDVTDRAAVRAAFEPVSSVSVFIHSAGVLADGGLGTVDAARGRLARAVKTEGFLNTLVAVNGSLEVALCIGSWAGRFGSRHQAHYASANALLSELVSRLPGRIRGVCPEFGPWTSSDMASTIPEAVQQAMRAEGVDFVGDAAGLDALFDDLGGSRGSIIRGRRVASTTRVRTRAETLSTATHPYLLDHAIEGRPVLPLAGAASMLTGVASVDAPFEIRDLTLFQGVAVDGNVPLAVSVSADRAELRQGDGNLCYRATVRPLADTPEEPEPLTGGDPPGLSLQRFYDEITFHGPLLQGMRAVDGVGADFVRGRVVTGDPKAWIPDTALERWPVDPLALDSAFQLAALVAFERYGRAGTPVGFDRFVQLRPMPAPGTEVTVECMFLETDDGDRFAADVRFRDVESGALLALCDNVVAQLREAPEIAAPDVTTEEVDLDEPGLPGGFEVKGEWVNPAEWPGYKELELRFQMVEALGLENPYFDLHTGTARDTSEIDGRDVINFSSYNYVGLSGDPRIRADVTEAMEKWGTSVSASRIASGERPFHRDLEALLASTLGVEDAIIFPSGHATNVTTIGHLFGPKDLILHDELIHDSCLQGIKLSGAARRSYRHEDVDHCEEQLRELRTHYEKVLILTEGVYSMDGDVSQTPAFVELKERYGCLLMIDEAHSFGTIGPNGFGIRDYYGLEGPEVDIWMGTMSKSLASMGGWIAGTKALVTYLRYTTPGFVFAAGMTPTIGQAALSALRLMHEEKWRVEKLQSNAAFFARALTEHGLDIGVAQGESPVVPVVTGSSMQALQLAQGLLEAGVNAKPIIYPAVADDAARLRFFLSSLHSEEQLTFTAETIRQELERIRQG